MNRYSLKFHHLGLAVANRGKAIRFVEGLGYRVGDEKHDPLQNVNVTLCRSDAMPTIEIITAVGPLGPLAGILGVRTEMIYHVCYSSHDLKHSLKALCADGIRVICVASPKPAILFDADPVSFYQIPGFGLIEILEVRK